MSVLLRPDDIALLRRKIAATPHAMESLQARVRQVAAQPLVQEVISRTAVRQPDFTAGRDAEVRCALASWLQVVAPVADADWLPTITAAVRHYSALPQWTSPHWAERKPAPWHSALETATMTAAFAETIDLVGCAWPDDVRQGALAALWHKGIDLIYADWVDPRRRVNVLDSMGHNWWAVCVGAMVMGALVCEAYGWPGATDLVDEGLAYLIDWFAYPGYRPWNKVRNFGRDGGFYESVSYTHYGLIYVLPLAHALQDTPRGRRLDAAIPWEGIAAFLEAATWVYNDHAVALPIGDTPAGQIGRPEVLAFLARKTGRAGLVWLARLAQEKRPSHHALLWLPDNVEGTACPAHITPPATPDLAAFYDIGWGIASLPAATATGAPQRLAVRAGTHWNHAHADAGSFIWEVNQTPLVVDSGVTTYGDPLYRRYFTTSNAHNVALWNNLGVPAEQFLSGSHFPAQLESALCSPGSRYLALDATGPMHMHLERHWRYLLLLPGGLLVIDDIQGHQPGVAKWLLHTASPPTWDGATRQITWQTADIQASAAFLWPTSVHFSTAVGWVAESGGCGESPYAVVETEKSARAQPFMVWLTASAAAQPQLQWGADNEACAFTLAEDGSFREVLVNWRADGRYHHNNANLRWGQWDTDAWICTRVKGDSQAHTAVYGGSYLRDGGNVLVSTSARCDMAYWFAGDKLCLVGRTGMAQNMWLGVPGISSLPGSLRINGYEQEFAWRPRDAAMVFTVPAGAWQATVALK